MGIPTAASAAACLLAATAAAAASVSDALAERGHPHTNPCTIESRSGLGNLFVVQFRTGGDEQQDRARAIEMLKLLAPAMPGAVHWLGFHAARRWESCRQRDPELVFWRDQDDNWRLVGGSPVSYLEAHLDGMEAAELGSPAEAYARFSLGVVEQRLENIDRSVEHFARANEILERRGDDPHGIRPYVLVPLIHHAASEGDDAAVDALLSTIAPLIDDVQGHEGEYLPLLKTVPAYPMGARRREITGHVLVEFTVDSRGRVQDPVIIEETPAGAGFGASALRAAREFRYIPRWVDGEFVEARGVRNLITFDLEP